MAMDTRFRSDEEWYISPVVVLKEFLKTAQDEYQEALEEMDLDATSSEATPENFADFAGTSKRTAEKVFEDISLSNLLKPDSRPVKADFETLNSRDFLRPESLISHEHAASRLQLFKKSYIKQSDYRKQGKYYQMDKFGMELNQWKPETSRSMPEDIIICVNVCKPYNRILTNEEGRLSRRIRAQTKFVCRGDMDLYRLRQRIACASDLAVYIEPGRELEKPDIEQCHVTEYPSSFLFIHDTFYVDYTMPNSADISEEIQSFLVRKKEFGPTKSVDMALFRIIDLTLRLGQPYLFQHSGNCEHIIIFTDLRLMTKDDPQPLSAYPVLAYEHGGSQYCSGCKRLEATMGVEQNTRLPMTPAFFCDECFKAFHFVHGERTGDFRAFPYFPMNKLHML